ncbi:hypothetical protein EB73_03420 [Mycobacterium sp. SWH-M3]|nr:hypothetical protein EB73_03420 [Mycobacterium sp. SWH-M3]
MAGLLMTMYNLEAHIADMREQLAAIRGHCAMDDHLELSAELDRLAALDPDTPIGRRELVGKPGLALMRKMQTAVKRHAGRFD